MKTKFVTPVAVSVVLASASAMAEKPVEEKAPEPIHKKAANTVSDAWLDARLETAYLFNRHLNNFSIQSHVDSGHVLLTGMVQSDIDRDLAEEIAKGLRGVKSVNNKLIVRADSASSEENADDREFVEYVEDATTTARVKANFLKNEHISALDIDVDTENAVVTLKGEVAEREHKQLAEYIARNTDAVKEVRNELTVSTS